MLNGRIVELIIYIKESRAHSEAYLEEYKYLEEKHFIEIIYGIAVFRDKPTEKRFSHIILTPLGESEYYRITGKRKPLKKILTKRDFKPKKSS